MKIAVTGCSDSNVVECGPGQITGDYGICKFSCELDEAPCSDGEDCTQDVCTNNEDGTFKCDNPNAADGTQGTSGASPGKCVAGVCWSLCVDVDCTPDNQCEEVGACDPADGTCTPGGAKPADSPCDQHGGQVCDGKGDCVECNEPAQCSSDECTVPTCEARECGTAPAEDLTECSEGVCFDGTCGRQLPCTEAAIRKALELGGRPYTLDCPDDAVIETSGVLGVDRDVIVDGDDVALDALYGHQVLIVRQMVLATLTRFVFT